MGQIFCSPEKAQSHIMFKTIEGLTPKYLSTTRNSLYDLKVTEKKLNLSIPRTNYLKRSFIYSEATLWNSLPVNLRCSGTLGQLK